LNHRTRYLDQTSFNSKVIVRTQSHTYCEPIALSGLEKLSWIADRSQTDRITAFDNDFWPWLWISGELWSWQTHIQTL